MARHASRGQWRLHVGAVWLSVRTVANLQQKRACDVSFLTVALTAVHAWLTMGSVQKAEEVATHHADTHFELLQQEVQARQDLQAQLDALQSADGSPAADVTGSALADAPAGVASAHVQLSDASVDLQCDGNVAKSSAAVSSCASEART
jgi:hypothetical protein